MSRRVAELIAAAQREIDAELATRVLIIEDEPIIAADIEALVRRTGSRGRRHRRHPRGGRLGGLQRQPGLVLADIQLADGSSGIDAVRDILGTHDVPVIFITAFPERLLTGRTAGADLPDHETVSGRDGESGDRPGAVLSSRARSRRVT